MSEHTGETGRWPEVAAFANLMRGEMDANTHKENWRSLPPGYLLSEVIGHVAKLMSAVDAGASDAILEHAADVANLSMMVADRTVGLPLFGRSEAPDGA